MLPNPEPCAEAQLPSGRVLACGSTLLATLRAGLADSAATPTQAADSRELLVIMNYMSLRTKTDRRQKTYPCAPQARASTSPYSESPPLILGWGPEVPAQSVPRCRGPTLRSR